MNKPRFDLDLAATVAEELLAKIQPCCVPGFAIVAGSIRRLKPEVGDIEILYVPRIERGRSAFDFFAHEDFNRVDEQLGDLFQARVLEKRRNVNNSEMFGPQNKFMRHVATGIPVDFFATTEAKWFNALVVRTGGAENNVAIASAASAKGWHWEMSGVGFKDQYGEIVPVTSEREVFTFVGLPYKEPVER